MCCSLLYSFINNVAQVTLCWISIYLCWYLLGCIGLEGNFPFSLGINFYWKMKSLMLTHSEISLSLCLCLCICLYLSYLSISISIYYIPPTYMYISSFTNALVLILVFSLWALSLRLLSQGHMLCNWYFTAAYEPLILEVSLPVRKAKFSTKEMPLHDSYYFTSILI